MRVANWVALFGALGSVSRYGIASRIQRASTSGLPFGTFTVNVVGSFVIGLVIAIFAVRGASQSTARIAITVGFLGGFTTYSAFAFETVSLIEANQLGRAAAYVMATFAIAGLGCWLGLVVGRLVAT